MTERSPDLSELLGDDVPADERERLQRAHEYVLAAGPLPELPPSLEHPPLVDDRQDERAAFALLPRRSGRIMTLAAGFAAMTLVIGYVIGHNRANFDQVQAVEMHGTAQAPRASGVIKVAKRDADGNFPLEVSVNGLRPLPQGSYYVLYLNKGKRPVAICGSFLVHGNATTVRMSAPYDYHQFSGWTVAVYTATKKKPGPTLLSTGNAV
jgi:hypothetical protein